MDFDNYSMMLLCDFYKISHREQYPKGTQVVYSTWTPRASKIERIDKVVAFGFQFFVEKFLLDWFKENFFQKALIDVLYEYTYIIEATLGVKDPDTKHIEALHKLGYLPLHIEAVPEGTEVPLRCPMLTIYNTHPDFFWLTNYIETLASTTLWMPSTSATIAKKYREILEFYADMTGASQPFVKFQAHDFSMRGHSSLESGSMSGLAHLTSFVGTDTIPAINMAIEYYGADPQQRLVGTSIPATEHSVMCAHGQDELESFAYLLDEVYPTGMVSIVCDTWDFWHVVTDVIGSPRMRRKILGRDGKVVIRPDSGDPVKIICGDRNKTSNRTVYKGLVEVLWDLFGGTINDKGYKVFNPHIGTIYGDAITLDRCDEICYKLYMKGFASTNVVFGVGSSSYQYQTRDTFGFALKSTLCVINGEEKQIFKNPKTDDGTKKSQKGAVVVNYDEHGRLFYNDELPLDHSQPTALETIFRDGKAYNRTNLEGVRRKLHGSSF